MDCQLKALKPSDRKAARAIILSFALALSGLFAAQAQTAPSVSATSGRSLHGAVAGQNVVAVSPTGAVSSPNPILTSGLAALNPTHDLCQLAQDARNSSATQTVRIVIDQSDNSGAQNCSVSPFSSLLTENGRLELAGTETILTTALPIGIPGNTTLEGMGNPSVSKTSSAKNSIIRPCNPLIRPCPSGAFSAPSATISSTTVSTTTITVNLSSAFPAYNAAVSIGPIAIGRKVQLVNNNGPSGGVGVTTADTLANGNTWLQVTGCTVPSSTCGQTTTSFTGVITSGSVTACASGCGTAYLDTYVIYAGRISTTPQQFIHLKHVTIDCQFLPGVGGYLNFNGQEKTDGEDVQVFNCMGPPLLVHAGTCTAYTAGGQCQDSAHVANAYGGISTGAVNSGPYSFTSGYSATDCALVAGCGSNGSGGAGWANGAVSVFPSASTTAYLNPDPATPNTIGALFEGAGLGQTIQGCNNFTVSDQDPNVVRVAEHGATGIGLLWYGLSGCVNAHHLEYWANPFVIGGDTAINGAFPGGPTSGLIIIGGFDSFTSGAVGYVFDLGSTAVNPISGVINPVADIDIRGVNVGNVAAGASKALIDNITGRKLDCYTLGNANNDYVVSYFLGHGTVPSVNTSSNCIDAFPEFETTAIETNALNGIAQVPATIRAPSGQTAHIQDWKLSGTITAYIDKNGNPSAAQINDFTNDLPVIILSGVANAVDQVTCTNAATANPATVQCAATGTDSNINVNIISKGSGTVQVNGLTLPSALTSGGVICNTSTTVEASSALLAAGALVVGGGAGVCPTTGSGDFTYVSHTLAGGAAAIFDMSAASTSSKPIPAAAGCTAAADGSTCYDTTAKNTHIRVNGADALALGTPSGLSVSNLLKSASATIGQVAQSSIKDDAVKITSAEPAYLGNGTSLASLTSITGTSLTSTLLVLPTVPISTTARGECHIIWEQLTATATVTFGIGAGSALTNLYVLDPLIWNGTALSVGPYTTITTTTLTNITAAITPAAIATAYKLDFQFTLITNGANTQAVTVYGLTSNAADALAIEPGSMCYWLP